MAKKEDPTSMGKAMNAKLMGKEFCIGAPVSFAFDGVVATLAVIALRVAKDFPHIFRATTINGGAGNQIVDRRDPCASLSFPDV